MSQYCAMKLNGSRNMMCAIEQMEWSNKMDLIAYGNEKGEVIIQRLNWQKIVTFPAIGDNIKVRSLSWQMDETVVAVGYSNGKVCLVDAECEDIISTLDYGEDIKRVYFSKAISTRDYRNTYRNRQELTFDFFLPQLPTLSGMSITTKNTESHKSFAKGSPCFLVVTFVSGKVNLLLLGALKAGSIDLSLHVDHPKNFDVYDIRLNSAFNAIYALVRDGNHMKLLHFDNEVLNQNISPMLHLAVHCANILETKNYINDTMQCMLEAWETVQLEMDNKLTKYANSQEEGSLSADFLELLLFGYATHEIEEFLMRELTEKGLKKLANSVDLSYSTIQSLVTKPLQSASINMFYFLNTLKGLARLTYYFEPLITPEATENALRLCGAFLMKVQEMQQVIDQCLNDMKLFFCWMSVVIARLHQQDLSEDVTQVTQEDTIYLAEYLNSFEDSVVENADGTVIKRKFNLEKIGQYLEDKPLQQMVKSDEHHLWNKLLQENECLRDCTLLYPHEKQTSLVQQLNKLLEAIESVFQKTNESVSGAFELSGTLLCCTLPSHDHVVDDDFIRTSYYPSTDSAKSDLLITTISWTEALILEFDTDFSTMRCLRVCLQPGLHTNPLTSAFNDLRYVDLQFYNDKVISMLLRQSKEDKPQSYFVQFTLDSANNLCINHCLGSSVNLADLTTEHSIFDIIDSTTFRSLDGCCTNIAVSGSRKIATVLSDGQKKMTIFEMEIEEDEDDTEISQNSLLGMSKDSSGLMEE